jgi:uncharacterized repeat protein (TIGR03803 family)
MNCRLSRIPATLASALIILLFSAVFSPAQTFTTLATLDTTTGTNPLSGLVQGFDGNFYGTAYEGGANLWGTFFQVTPSGTLTPLYSFCPDYNQKYFCPLGGWPQGAIALGTDGYFYGVSEGGFFGGQAGDGTAYKISSAGSMTVLHQFCQSTCTDGSYPTQGLTMSSSGEFYGLSNAPENSTAFYGQVFKIDSNGQFYDVLTVCPNTICPTDAGPIGALLLSPGGALIGPGPGPGGHTPLPAALYKMTLSGVPTVLHSFCDNRTCFDGWGSIPTPLAQSATGEIYGTFPKVGPTAKEAPVAAPPSASPPGAADRLPNSTTSAASPVAPTATTPMP